MLVEADETRGTIVNTEAVLRRAEVYRSKMPPWANLKARPSELQSLPTTQETFRVRTAPVKKLANLYSDHPTGPEAMDIAEWMLNSGKAEEVAIYAVDGPWENLIMRAAYETQYKNWFDRLLRRNGETSISWWSVGGGQ